MPVFLALQQQGGTVGWKVGCSGASGAGTVFPSKGTNQNNVLRVLVASPSYFGGLWKA